MELYLIEKHVVKSIIVPIRLSDVPAGTFESILSRKAFKNAIKAGLVKVNGKVAFTSNFINGGEEIEIFQNNFQKKKPTIDLKLDIIFEDDYLAIIYKPAGIVVSGNKKYTLENALQSNLKKSSQKDALIRPEPAHRLDYPTSGLLLVGKTSEVIIALNKMFELKTIQKTYHAITVGQMKDFGNVKIDIDNKVCSTGFKVLERLPSKKYLSLNLVELTPYTGRKHQLRIHLASIGSPIFGDLKYGEKDMTGRGNGLYLHATSLKFIHPISGMEVYETTSLPKKFKKLFPNS